MSRIIDVPQGTEEWRKARAGHATGSCFADILAKIKSGEAADRRKYRIKLVTERMTGVPIDGGFKSAAMQWGTDTEALARTAYEAATGEPCIQTGFHLHPTIEWVGCSPDGLVGDDGLAQFKCPESHTHVAWLLDGVLPSEHRAQVQGELWVTGRAWCDFVSFDPRFPASHQLLIVRVQRDEEYISNLEREVKVFLREVDQLHSRLLNGGALAKAA